MFVGARHVHGEGRVGKHTFVAEKHGYTTRINAPFIGPGENFRIELKLYTAEELTRYHRRWDATWMPYAVIGAGACVGDRRRRARAVGEQSSYNDYDKQVAACNMNNQGCQIDDDAHRSAASTAATRRRRSATSATASAAAAIVVGAVLAYLNRREAYQIRAEDLDEEHVSVAPVVAPGWPAPHGAGALLDA